MNDTSRILEAIRSRIDAATDPIAIINELTPRTRTDAVKWARRLPLYDEFAAIYGKQVVGLARTIAKRALREQGLRLSKEGRITDEAELRPRGSGEKPTRTFMLPVQDSEAKVEYTRNYFPQSDQDAFYFVRADYVPPPPEAPYQMPGGTKPHPLSDTGFLNKFANHDAVEACGGPEAYARLFAAAQLRDAAKDFDEVFEGKRPEVTAKRKRRPDVGKGAAVPESVSLPRAGRAVVGEHTARVAEEPSADQPTQGKVSQHTLF